MISSGYGSKPLSPHAHTAAHPSAPSYRPRPRKNHDNMRAPQGREPRKSTAGRCAAGVPAAPQTRRRASAMREHSEEVARSNANDAGAPITNNRILHWKVRRSNRGNSKCTTLQASWPKHAQATPMRVCATLRANCSPRTSATRSGRVSRSWSANQAKSSDRPATLAEPSI
jgi:hypothetical protein